MDQESFRRLLETPAGSSTSSRDSLFKLGFRNSEKIKTIDASQPAFKPRKVKKASDSHYRDRAAERRIGEGNDYAQVEAVLEDFEKRNIGNEDKAAVERQRRYLGGDGEHSILVKGLDVALLEQNKARATLSTEDDDSLEQAFREAASGPIVPKKRTRDDLIRELKEKRAQKGEGVAIDNEKVVKTAEEETLFLEEAKKKGKFKPIGFKPIGALDVSTKKKKKVKSDGTDVEKKKKRRKVEQETTKENLTDKITKQSSPAPSQPAKVDPLSQNTCMSVPEPKPIPEDFDIFAGAGEYEGLDLGDDDDDDDGEISPHIESHPNIEEGEVGPAPRRWIETDEEELPATKPEMPPPKSQHENSLRQVGSDQGDEEGEIEEPTRLVPLASSALPSIKDFLAMDGAAGSSTKRRKRGGKKKSAAEGDEVSKKRSTEAKVDRDYKRLKNYTDKREAAPK
ncbi:hypothetical protein BDZ94DRAFT_1213478 [Collybia nuda]|uniref:RED-like N-terminal domain-containing protein n=1 Tax=Collybia nuda TaxID=64659 RepID=A0A9P5Y9K1_9AGAR|nr:hypothetical protein BDZ94DRAFT_1213478 [Collybia nuda]